MENCTNCSENDQVYHGFGILTAGLLLFLIFILLLFVGTIILLCKAHSVVRILQIFLVNLLVAGLVITLVTIVFAMVTLILGYSSAVLPDLFCRFLIWGFLSGITARLYSLATFSLIVLSIVRYHKRDIKTAYIISLLVLIWLVSLLLNVYTFIPEVYGVQYYGNVACFSNYGDKKVVFQARLTFSFLSIVFGGIVPLIISIVVPIVVLFYIKRNTTATELSSYTKPAARLALFLVVGNLLNFLGVVIITILAYVFKSFAVAVHLTYIVAVIFLLPTPILVIAFMKPVREKLKSLMCCSLKQNTRLPSSGTEKVVFTK